MSLKIYNTQKGNEEEFAPLNGKKVSMYVCGPTVYDVLHVGNFRGVIFFNLVRNWLERSGYDVTYVYNYTDIDDKIIKRANDEGKTSEQISAEYIKEFEKDFSTLKLTSHDHNPRATEYIKNMVSLIEKLIEKKRAYVAEGEVLYSVESFSDYGKLSHKNIEELQAGHRVEVDPKKRSALDFVLWKPSKEGEPSWDSPWGPGRPGWHIECSVMSREILGETIDIHGGGIDLIFPHHENEIAQSEGASDKPFVKYWMHNNFINFGDTKMSKSLGNIVTGRSFLEKYNGEILKYLILSVHYRSPLSLADTQIQQAIASLARIYASLRSAEHILAAKKETAAHSAFEEQLKSADTEYNEALNSDFNTPAAFAKIFDVVRAFNTLIPKSKKFSPELVGAADSFKKWVTDHGKPMSLFQEPAADFLVSMDSILLNEMGLEATDIDNKVLERNKARENKDFKKADALRDELNELGIEIQDSINGTSWEVKKS